jgi:hypothetical protein
VCTGVTLAIVPTRRPRHALTETPPVQEALDELRRELGAQRLEIAELVILGAREKLARLRSEQHRRAELVKRLAQRVRDRRVPGEPAAAEEVRRTGWARD